MEIQELLTKVRKIEIKSRKIVNTTFLGEYHSAFKGKGIEFSEVREYTYGDDVRSIDWKVTSRMNSPFVKVNHEERELTVFLLIDVSKSIDFATKNQSKRDLIAEISAVFAFSAITNNDKVGLILFSEKVHKYIKPAKGRKQTLRIIREIINFEVNNDERTTNIAEALTFLDKIQKKRSIIFLLSDFHSKGFKKPFKYISKKHDLIPVSVTDPSEKSFPNFGLIRIKDFENNNTQSLNTSNKTWHKSFLKTVNTRENQLEKLFKEAQTEPLQLSTDIPYLGTLLNYFKRVRK